MCSDHIGDVWVLSSVALASAADVSCLEISSRTARSRESWSVILKVRTSDTCLYRLLSQPSYRKTRHSITARHSDGAENQQGLSSLCGMHSTM